MVSSFLDPYSAVIALMIIGMIFALFLVERLPPTVVAIMGAAIFVTLGFIDTKDTEPR